MFDWAEILAIVNVLLAGLLAVLQVRLFMLFKVARFIRFLLILIGLYWCGLYVFVALVEPGFVDPVWFGHIFVRPAFTFSLAVMVASALYRFKS